MHRRQAAAAARRQQVASLYVRGNYQSEIAKALGISQAQVSYDLQAVQRAWLASSIRDFDALKAEQLAKIDAVERNSWEAWTRSQQPRESTLQESVDGKRKMSRRLENQAGDPRFLERIQKCIDQRCEILGLHGTKRYHIDWDSLSDEQLIRIASGEEIAQVLGGHGRAPERPMPEA